jgi:DMSO/TMAO reductase YedYZ heme-binding membrane subunit
VWYGGKFFLPLWHQNLLTAQSFSQVPLIIGLASRNNVISWLTGVSYEKLNYLHRASGRVCALMAWIHAMSWVQRGLAHDVMPGDPQFAAGVVGLIGLTIMYLTSFAFVRRMMYEAFIVIHIMFCL